MNSSLVSVMMSAVKYSEEKCKHEAEHINAELKHLCGIGDMVDCLHIGGKTDEESCDADGSSSTIIFNDSCRVWDVCIDELKGDEERLRSLWYTMDLVRNFILNKHREVTDLEPYFELYTLLTRAVDACHNRIKAKRHERRKTELMRILSGKKRIETDKLSVILNQRKIKFDRRRIDILNAEIERLSDSLAVSDDQLANSLRMFCMNQYGASNCKKLLGS